MDKRHMETCIYKKAIRNLLFIITVALAAIATSAQSQPLEIKAKVHKHFRFVAYGDTRFTDPANTKDANPEARQQLVRAIADVHPDFITFGGDIALSGDRSDDWKVYDQETAIWRERKIPVYPALGNHDLHGDLNTALGNYFARFPVLEQNRFYAVHAANSLMLTLDSALDEEAGPPSSQGEWLRNQLDHLASNVDFVFVVMHHPPYTSSTDDKTLGGGHSIRSKEQKLAEYLEEQQKKQRARIVVFSGHVHNYERHERGGVTYFVSGGGGAHAYPILRGADDPFQSKEVNYHYLLVDAQPGKLKITMNRLELVNGVATWTQPDSVTILSPAKAGSSE
jgi:Icc-related predicted phosphoesterase